MKKGNISLYTNKDNYQVGGISHVVVWKSKGDIVVETPEIGFRSGIDGEAMKGFSLDERTHELFIEFLQSGKPNKINVGIVSDYGKASSWVESVNELYSK